MALAYRAVDWNRQKRLYDLTLVTLLIGGVATFIGVTLIVSPNTTAETLILRSTALSALLLLHVILSIGPLARLDARFLPWLYNRRHLGVTLFLLAALHGVFALIQFHALGDQNPLVSVFTAYQRDYRILADGRINVAHFPFEPLGVAALILLFFLASTSHDFWLRTLGASVWKQLHLGVYLAYGFVLAHVAFGALQSERSAVYPVVLTFGFAIVAGLHLAAARQEFRRDHARRRVEREGFIEVGSAAAVREGRGKVVLVGAQRLAVYRHQDRIFATSNVCRHQGGPVGEGRIIDGCITCPWHGWNYHPEDGVSPPPFKEVLETYDTQILGGRLWVKRQPNPLRTRCAGSREPASDSTNRESSQHLA